MSFSVFAVLCGVLSSFIVAPLANAAAKSETRPKIIEWGWDTPPPTFIAEHIGEMEKLPFDGLVIDVPANEGVPAANRRLAWEVWSSSAVRPTDYSVGIGALHRTQFVKFKDNFLRFNVTPGDVDWFDAGIDSVVLNAGFVARTAKELGFKGILLDTEQYQGRPFDYSQRPLRASRSFDEYAGRTREIGSRFGSAIRRECGECVVMVTFGFAHADALSQGLTPEKRPYGFLPAFLKGVLDSGIVVIDAFEASYAFSEARQFEAARQAVYSAPAARPYAGRNYFASYGIWIDYKTWNERDPEANHFTPASFRRAIRAALQKTDRYIWIYSQKVDWWRGSPPEPYRTVLEDERRSILPPSP